MNKKTLIIILASIFVIAGCNLTPKSANMVVKNLRINNKNNFTAGTQVIGVWAQDSIDGNLFSYVLTNQAYKEAMDTSLIKSQLFSKIVDINTADYILTVEFQKKSPTNAGFMSSIQTEWSLTKSGQSTPLWKKTVVSSYSDTFGESLNGLTRPTRSLEGVARENIKEGIQLISELNLE